MYSDNPSDDAVQGVGLRLLVCWNWGLESRLTEWISVSCECCVHCQVDVSSTGRSLVQRSHTECDVSECDYQTSKLRLSSHKKKKLCIHTSDLLTELQIFTVTKIYFVVLWAMD